MVAKLPLDVLGEYKYARTENRRHHTPPLLTRFSRPRMTNSATWTCSAGAISTTRAASERSA